MICEGEMLPRIVIIDKLALMWLIRGIKKQIISLAAPLYDRFKIATKGLSATQSMRSCDEAILGDYPSSGLTPIANVEFPSSVVSPIPLETRAARSVKLNCEGSRVLIRSYSSLVLPNDSYLFHTAIGSSLIPLYTSMSSAFESERIAVPG